MTTDLTMLEASPARAMTATEEALARSFYEAVQKATNESPRSLQAAGHRIGVSDLGHCSERVRRSLAGMIPEQVDKTKAFVGTALGDHIEQAVTTAFPNLIRQAEVEVALVGDIGTYVLTGHPDLIDPEGAVWDLKTVNGLERVRRTGPSQSQSYQVHLYGLAAHRAGLFDPQVSLEDVVVGDIWFDRSAEEPVPYVYSTPFDMRVVESATQWLDDVVYAYIHDEEARKEPPIAMCEKTCGYYLDCRAGRNSSGGLIDAPELLAAVSMYTEATELEREARRLKNQAKIALNGTEGSTGTHTVKWTKVDGSDVSYHRDPYLRLDVRRLR